MYNNFNTYEWLDRSLSQEFNGGAGGDKLEKPSVGEFYAMAGKGKLCKSAGLTGAEKRACKKNIKTTCGRKPLFGRAKKAAWMKCAEGAVVTPEQAAQEAVDKLLPESKSEGLGTGAKVMLGVGLIGFVALVGFAVVGKKKRASVAIA